MILSWAFDGLFLTYLGTKKNQKLIYAVYFNLTVRSFSTEHQALGFPGVSICPVGMTFFTKTQNASTQINSTVKLDFSPKFPVSVLAQWHSSIGFFAYHLLSS